MRGYVVFALVALAAGWNGAVAQERASDNAQARTSPDMRESAVAGAQKRPITEKDLFDFVWIGDPQVSPDGSRVAFVRVTVNEPKTGYDTAIWLVDAAGKELPRALTSGPRDSSPRWSPDGKSLAFVRSLEKDGKPEPPQIWLLPLQGGDSFAVTEMPRGAVNPSWSPDSHSIAFLSDMNAEDLAMRARSQSGEPQPPPERESDVHIVTRAVYRADSAGHIDACTTQMC